MPPRSTLARKGANTGNCMTQRICGQETNNEFGSANTLPWPAKQLIGLFEKARGAFDRNRPVGWLQEARHGCARLDGSSARVQQRESIAMAQISQTETFS